MTDTLLALFLGIAFGALLALWWVSWKLGDVLTYVREGHRELMELKIFVRARSGKRVAMQSGPVSEEQTLSRLGRASVGRRVVVGGDPDSTLNAQLMTQVPEDDEDE